ncbi:MAG: DUF4412 domain-containing protein [Deltaproteobacteria bacterium]|nr:DUF4412 domain-containing protein [Deltaproteobacteria bacterium]
MRLISKAWILLALLGLPDSAARAAETGTYIEQEVIHEASQGQPAARAIQRIWFTDKHIRAETSFGEEDEVTLFDIARGRVLMLIADKRFVELSLADYQRIVAMRLGRTGLDAPGEDVNLEQTGQKRTIGAWKCELFRYSQGGRNALAIDLWVSQDAGLGFAAYLELMRRLGQEDTLGRLSDFADRVPGFPVELRIEQTVFGQKLVSTSRARKIATGPTDPSLFELPAGYQRLGAKDAIPGVKP